MKYYNGYFETVDVIADFLPGKFRMKTFFNLFVRKILSFIIKKMVMKNNLKYLLTIKNS